MVGQGSGAAISTAIDRPQGVVQRNGLGVLQSAGVIRDPIEGFFQGNRLCHENLVS